MSQHDKDPDRPGPDRPSDTPPGETVEEALEGPSHRTPTSAPSTTERPLRKDEFPEPGESAQG